MRFGQSVSSQLEENFLDLKKFVCPNLVESARVPILLLDDSPLRRFGAINFSRFIT